MRRITTATSATGRGRRGLPHFAKKPRNETRHPRTILNAPANRETGQTCKQENDEAAAAQSKREGGDRCECFRRAESRHASDGRRPVPATHPSHRPAAIDHEAPTRPRRHERLRYVHRCRLPSQAAARANSRCVSVRRHRTPRWPPICSLVRTSVAMRRAGKLG